MNANSQAEQATTDVDSLSPMIALNQFVLRQVGVTDASPRGGWTGDAQSLLALLHAAVEAEIRQEHWLAAPVVILHYYPTGAEEGGRFVGTFDTVRPGEHVEAVYEPRREGEAPVWTRRVRRKTRPSPRRVDLVLYSHDNLGTEATSFAQHELVSVNGVVDPLPADQDEPPVPSTLWRNYCAKDPASPHGVGGTYREEWNDPQAFLAELDRSERYWADKAQVVIDPDAEF